MKFYYLDIETDSHKTPTNDIDFNNSPIITIQYQLMDASTGKSLSELIILKVWESSEEQILRQFYKIYNPFDYDKRWDFIPVGFNLHFEYLTLLHRWKHLGIPLDVHTLLRRPLHDIQPIVTMFNKGIFKGATLEHFSGKKGTGADIKPLYDSQDYAAIEEYIKDEASCFLKLYQFIAQELPKLWYNSHKDNT